MRFEQVAVVCGDNGCELLAKVKTVSQQEYNKLANECERKKTKHLRESEELLNQIKEHNKAIKHLCKRDFLLAKTIYDRFVDRGYIDQDKNFDKSFYEYIFEGKILTEKDYPEDFKKILEKVVNL